MSPVFPNSIEVFDLAENQDMLSPVELDPEKLAHKFKEVYVTLIIWIPIINSFIHFTHSLPFCQFYQAFVGFFSLTFFLCL